VCNGAENMTTITSFNVGLRAVHGDISEENINISASAFSRKCKIAPQKYDKIFPFQADNKNLRF
jgi:hypothetical protein